MTTNRSDLFTHERRQQIIAILEEQQRATVPELSRLFAVSEVTIRKDLAWLANLKPIVRTHGGAILVSGTTSELGFDTRERLQHQEKTRIGIAAAKLVDDGETIALDSSTSSLYLVRALGTYKELTVVTNNLRSAMELCGRPGISVLMSGGLVRWEAYSLVSTLEETIFQHVHIKRAFVGAKGFSLAEGLTDINRDEVLFKRDMVAAAKEVVALIDHTKWDKVALATFCKTDRLKTIVTDSATPRHLIEQVRERGIEVIVV
ncbi:MAG: DeoR/GlpR transcriptional regulator [Chloroflexi bacterium]|nr:DeoR/GlpR transcriptional regulator [Chloroflexota bacterium]